MAGQNKRKLSNDIADNDKTGLRNKETNIITFFFVALFGMMIIYLVLFNFRTAEQIINNPYNKRVDNQSLKVVRGDILTRDGVIVAKTAIDENGEEYREYPFDNIFCHSVGFASSKIKTGIEQSENFYLLSETDNIFDQISNDISGKKPKGANVNTTLDFSLSEAAYKALGDNKGAVIAMDPKTGEILCMVSSPSFNPNDADEKYEEWLNYESADSVLLNRATQGLYPPGSTFKIITALEFIRENDNYLDYSYMCEGSAYISGGTSIACFDSNVHGNESLLTAFANSCNSSFSTIGCGLNKTSFINLCNTFLFNSNLPVGFEYSKSSFSLTENSSISEMQETAIGQGKTMISPLHNLMIVSTIANKGVMMKPYIVDNIIDASGKCIKQNKPDEIGLFMSESEACYLTECMREVVVSGTGNSLRYSDFKACGKTGSAQYDDSDNYHSWFVGFAPCDDPEIAICVILEGEYKGVPSAQYVARSVFEEFFKP